MAALGSVASGAALAVLWGWPHSRKRAKRAAAARAWSRARQTADLYLDLAEVEVEAVYVLGAELFTRLRGGSGRRVDPVTGNQRHIETSDVSLTWHCSGKRSAARLADKLNEWQARQTPLRLLAARGQAALLMESDNVWVVLPELQLAEG